MGTGREVSARFVPFLTLFYFVFGFFQFSYLALAETNEVIIQLKQQDIERYLMYERDKKTAPQYAMKQTTSQALPVDTDDDGMPDEWEVAQSLNPNDPDDAWFDPDGDEVVNLFEYQLGSDINDPTTPPVVTVAPVGAEFSDVSTAIEAVAPGTTLRVAGGSYAVNYTTFDPKVVMLQGGWDADFRQRDLQRSPTILDGGQLEEILYFSNNRGEPVIILDGLHFVRGSGFFGAVNLHAEGNTFLRTSVVNCTITESVDRLGFGGVLSLHHRDMSRSDRTIANTIIAGNVGSGINSQNTNDSQARWRLIHTTISHNTNGNFNGYGIEAFTLGNGMLDAHIYNSIIWGNEQDDISISRNIIFDVHHSDIGNVNATSGAVYEAGDGVLNVDPLFVDPLSNDFHLQASSPVLDQGIETGIPGTDFEGDPRIVETGADFGADEYLANSIPVANAGGDQTVRLSNQVDLDGSGSSDADGDTLSYDWSIAQAPAGSVSTLTEPAMAQTSFTPDRVGTYVVNLIVNDGQSDSLPDQVSSTVTDALPGILVGQWELTEGRENGGVIANLSAGLTIMDETSYSASFNDGTNSGSADAMYTTTDTTFESNMDSPTILNGTNEVFGIGPDGMFELLWRTRISSSRSAFDQFGSTAIGFNDPAFVVNGGILTLTSPNGRTVLSYQRVNGS